MAQKMCFNTQPRGGGCALNGHFGVKMQSFNTQPRGGGCSKIDVITRSVIDLFQHTAARRRLHLNGLTMGSPPMFQHTAARRRLRYAFTLTLKKCPVSTHSRAEAAASVFLWIKSGWIWFQHTAARRRLLRAWRKADARAEFQHTAARRRLLPS